MSSPQPTLTKAGSLALFTAAVVSIIGSLLILAYLITAIVKHKTDPEFAGESISQAQGAVGVCAVGLGLLTLLAVFLPSWFLYLRNGRRRDRLSLTLSGLSLMLLGLQFFAVLFELGS